MTASFATDLASARQPPCLCGCQRPARQGNDFHASACRTRKWKQDHDYTHPSTRKAREHARNARLRRRQRHSGRQVSFRKAVRVVALLLDELHPDDIRLLHLNPGSSMELSEDVLTRVLPERQRKEPQ